MSQIESLPYTIFRQNGVEGVQHSYEGVPAGVSLHPRPDHIERLQTCAHYGAGKATCTS
jgi:hypothetical protein